MAKTCLGYGDKFGLCDNKARPGELFCKTCGQLYKTDVDRITQKDVEQISATESRRNQGLEEVYKYIDDKIETLRVEMEEMIKIALGQDHVV